MFHVNSNLQRFKNLTQYRTIYLQDNNSDNLSMAAKGMQRGGGGYMVWRKVDFSHLNPDLSGYYNICFQKPEGNFNMQVLCTPYLYVKD